MDLQDPASPSPILVPFSDEDAAKYIINLMPKRLGSDARRIERQVSDAGKLTDLMYLSRELKKVVYQKTKAKAPPNRQRSW